RKGGRRLQAAGGEHGRRRVHVCLPATRSGVRRGASRVQPRRAAQPRRMEDRGRGGQPDQNSDRHPRSRMKLTLGFSPCPNDCFMFDAIVNQRIDLEGLEFSVQLADIEALNRAALAKSIDVLKLSYYAYSYCSADYVLLNSGSTLGRNCGPLLVSKRTISTDEVVGGKIKIAIPGKCTSANLLLSIAFPQAQRKTELLFSAIESELLANRFDAGLVIHEGRFTYESKGLKKIIDLGEFWDQET